jgi:UDP-N-acetylglucosamine:LPS N-acetylglucosamine transferase
MLIFFFQNLREDMDAAQAVMDSLREAGEELVDLIGEPDKPEVEKNLDDAESAWKGLNSKWANRQRQLDDALRKATTFQEELMVRLLSTIDPDLDYCFLSYSAFWSGWRKWRRALLLLVQLHQTPRPSRSRLKS